MKENSQQVRVIHSVGSPPPQTRGPPVMGCQGEPQTLIWSLQLPLELPGYQPHRQRVSAHVGPSTGPDGTSLRHQGRILKCSRKAVLSAAKGQKAQLFKLLLLLSEAQLVTEVTEEGRIKGPDLLQVEQFRVFLK